MYTSSVVITTCRSQKRTALAQALANLYQVGKKKTWKISFFPSSFFYSFFGSVGAMQDTVSGISLRY